MVAATALKTVDILVKEIFAGMEYRKSYTQTEDISLLQTYSWTSEAKDKARR
jgi:hypothetical protein